METLKASGLDQALTAAVHKGIPVLGICVGAQLILDSSEESTIPCLGWIAGKTRRFRLADPSLKVPHIGWNEVKAQKAHPLLGGLQAGDEFYFVHSYYPDPADKAHVYAAADYGGEFCCALGKDNLFATQFHPEKSGRFGLELLSRFSRWEGTC
jgi:glutamine amidotransferase